MHILYSLDKEMGSEKKIYLFWLMISKSEDFEMFEYMVYIILYMYLFWLVLFVILAKAVLRTCMDKSVREQEFGGGKHLEQIVVDRTLQIKKKDVREKRPSSNAIQKIQCAVRP